MVLMNILKGNLLLWILLAFVTIALIPPVIMMLFPMADIIMRVILIVLIYSTVRGFLGPGMITMIVSAVLIFILVIKHAYMSTSIYVIFYVLMAFQFLGVVVWGLNSVHMMTRGRG